jgi:release factor glutamine methyltransferase
LATIHTCLLDAVQRLAAQTETPALEAQVLLAHCLGLPREWLLAHPESELTDSQAAAFEVLLVRLINEEPLPYLLGRWEFYGMQFAVDPAVLIPRPETELLVETALEWLRTHPDRRRAADVGSGSGCIAVSLAANLPDLQVTAVDLSPAALDLARCNAERHAVTGCILFLQGDLLSEVKGVFDLICANLPYIPSADLDKLPPAVHEPRLALDGGPDGLDLIRRLLEQAGIRLAPGGLLLAEIEERQGAAAAEAGRQGFPAAEVSIRRDLAGRPRLLVIERRTRLVNGSDPAALPLAAAVLRRGGLAAFPTDTVYGLAADAWRGECIQQLFTAKGRDANKAIAVLVGDPAQLSQVAAEVSSAARRLAERFWPGPLTLVLPRHPDLPPEISPLPTVGVRMPDHPLALALLRQMGPLAVTSANRSGADNPLTAEDVLSQLDGRIDLILDGGAVGGGVPSTVVDCTASELTILRQGPISLQEILAAASG